MTLRTSFKPFAYFGDFVSSVRYGNVSFSSCEMRQNETVYLLDDICSISVEVS
jgi:hypothetical protein